MNGDYFDCRGRYGNAALKHPGSPNFTTPANTSWMAAATSVPTFGVERDGVSLLAAMVRTRRGRDITTGYPELGPR